MKKKVLSVLLTLACVALCASMFACGVRGEGNGSKATVYFMNDANDQLVRVEFVAQSKVMTITEKTSLYDYLKVLKEGEKITFEGEDSGYGFYITSVNGRENKTVDSDAAYEGYSWMVYLDFTVLEGDPAVYASDFATVTSRDGKTLYSASYGVSGIPCIEGRTYSLVYEHYSYPM